MFKSRFPEGEAHFRLSTFCVRLLARASARPSRAAAKDKHMCKWARTVAGFSPASLRNPHMTLRPVIGCVIGCAGITWPGTITQPRRPPGGGPHIHMSCGNFSDTSKEAYAILQDQPGRPPFSAPRGGLAEAGAGGCPPPRQAGAEAPAQCLPAGAHCGGPLALQPQTPHMTPPCRRGFIVARDDPVPTAVRFGRRRWTLRPVVGFEKTSLRAAPSESPRAAPCVPARAGGPQAARRRTTG